VSLRVNPVLQVVILTPVVIAPLVLIGVYFGFYVGDATGYSRSILAIAFSTVGFLIAIALLVAMIKRVVAKGAAPSERASSEPQPSP